VTAEKLYAGQTVEMTRRALAAALKAKGIDSSELDARILVGAVLGLDFTALIAAAGRAITEDQSRRLAEFARRRVAGEPVARILGFKEFWGLPFKLSAETLVPRADTEAVVELALEIWREAINSVRRPRVADIGTGSGAILLALLSEIPQAEGLGTDISVAALRTAKANAGHLGFAERTTFIACNYASALSGPFDLMVSNPPYIRSVEIGSLSSEVRDHDPRAALDGGADGLDAYRAIIPEAARLLGPGGALIVEAGLGQSGLIQELMTAAGLTLDRPPKPDLAGIFRAVAGRKSP
jgi:release factor glutamine methyltransferase